MPPVSWDQVRGTSSAAGHRAARIFTVVQRQPTWVTKIAFAAGAIALAALALVLIIPAVVIGLIFFAGAAAVAAVHGLLRRLRSPGGLVPRREGRRNVRVVRPREDL